VLADFYGILNRVEESVLALTECGNVKDVRLTKIRRAQLQLSESSS
jgi:hypothetical protein